MWVVLPSVGEGMVVLWDMVPFPHTPRKLDQSSITDVWEHTHMVSPTRAITSIFLPLRRLKRDREAPGVWQFLWSCNPQLMGFVAHA